MKTNNFQKALGENLLVSISAPSRYLLGHNQVTNGFEEHEIIHTLCFTIFSMWT